MTEAERRSFITYAASRGPGKRQIKPNAAVLLAASANDADDDDDEDFVAEEKMNANSSDTSDGTDSYSSDEDEDDSATDSEDEKENGEHEDKKESETSEDESDEHGEVGILICALCLNQRESVRKEEVIQCDKCGLAVHENCYMVDSTEDTDSTISSAVTEPWFCEPCLYGLKSPPYCELCPSRYGAFKRSDIGGGWVHLLCALYTPGITFGDIERLSAVSWQEIDYKLFGKKPCALCKDPLLARTGITVSCDAALCKATMHVTCAQRLGLLVDNSEVGNGEEQSKGKPQTSKQKWYFANADTVDPRFLTCQRHSNPDTASRLKHACTKFYKQEEERMRIMHRRVLTQREEKKRQRALVKHKKLLKSLEGISIAWPEHDNKRPRLLNTSPMLLDLFRDKAMCAGLSYEQFERSFKQVDGAELPFLPAGFSHEFLSYFDAREKVLSMEQMRLEELEAERAELRKQQSALEKELSEVERMTARRVQSPTIDHTRLQDWYTTLVALGVRKIRKPPTPSIREPSPNKQQRAPKASICVPSTSSMPSVKAVSTKRNGRINRASVTLDLTKTPTFNVPIEHTPSPMCNICCKSTEQHLLVLCDVCKKHYHLACLDPPLTKMPKKNRNYGWECSICAERSDEDEEENNNDPSVNESEMSHTERKLRDRTGVSEKRKEEEKALQRAFRSVMASHRRPPIKRRRTLSGTGAGQALARHSIMGPLSIDVNESGEGSSRAFDSSWGASSEHLLSSPVVKRSRNCSTNTTLQRFNGSLVKVNGVRKNNIETASRKQNAGAVGTMKGTRRLSIGTKRSGTLPPNLPSFRSADRGRFTNGLLAMISPH